MARLAWGKAALLVAATACSDHRGGLGEPGDVEEIRLPYSVSSCATAPADIWFNSPVGNHINLGVTSPQSYDTCTKAYVVDLFNVAQSAAGGYVSAVWADTLPGTQASCEDTEGGAIFYKRVGSQWVPITGQSISRGLWEPTSRLAVNPCRTPAAMFGPLEAGASYRIAATMRRISGGNPTRQLTVKTFPRMVALSAGGAHTCAKLFNGSHLRCWGAGSDGKLGYGGTRNVGDDMVPSAAGDVPVGGVVTQVSAGSSHTCALLVGGAVRCWGNGANGRLGYGNTNSIGDNEAPSVAGNVNIGGIAIQIAAGGAHTCALLANGVVRCWGDGTYGQLGYGNTNTIGDNETPGSLGVDVNLGGITATQIAAGGSHTCALMITGAVRCWGRGASGQLGYGNTNNIGDNETPASAGNVNVGGPVSQIAAGDAHTCALLTATGGVRCWGDGASGRLGYANTNNIGDNETPLSAGSVSVGAATQVAAGGAHTCAILQNGSVRCWGLGANGQLGYGNVVDIGDNEGPSSVGAVSLLDLTVSQIVAGWRHTCVLTNAGRVQCWGGNLGGQLGYGNSNSIGDTETPALAGTILIWGGCVDKTHEQMHFGDETSGCAGSVNYASRETLCARGWTAALASEWVSAIDGSFPTHNYWTYDDLRRSGTSTACIASVSSGTSCSGSPMRVCVSADTDPEGNVCGWTNCGLDTATPNRYFGGCVGDTAGTLCRRRPLPATGGAGGAGGSGGRAMGTGGLFGQGSGGRSP
jgi:alpha-tubulin suppressor-like RCC1 family protein